VKPSGGTLVAMNDNAQRPGHGAGDDSAVDHPSGRLAAYKAPRVVVMVATIGRSPAGKVDYARLGLVAKETVEQAGGDESRTLVASGA